MNSQTDKHTTGVQVSRAELVARLAHSAPWSANQANHVRRFFRYLDFYRQQNYNARLLEIEELFAPFDPDRGRDGKDAIVRFNADELVALRKRFICDFTVILERRGYKRLDVAAIMSAARDASSKALEPHIDLSVFDDLLIFGSEIASTTTQVRRRWWRVFHKSEVNDPCYNRVVLVYKLKTAGEQIEDLVKSGLSRDDADRRSRESRTYLSDVPGAAIHIRSFRSIHASQLSMLLPGLTLRSSITGKLGLLVLGAVGFLFHWLGPVSRLAGKSVDDHKLWFAAQTGKLYLHHIVAAGPGVISLEAREACTDDVKEEMLAYWAVSSVPGSRREGPEYASVIAKFMEENFGTATEFDTSDAIERLLVDGLVSQDVDGRLTALAPDAAAMRVDASWDNWLDHLSVFDEFVLD